MGDKTVANHEDFLENSRFKLARIRFERNVPYDTFMSWIDKLNSLNTDSERDEYAVQMVEYVDKHYPLMPKEEFLQNMEKSGDWENLRHRMRIYWHDLRSMFMDAVRLGMSRIVEETAPHCLFDKADLQDTCLQIAPNEATRIALKNRVIINKDSEYEHYPFCCVYNERCYKYQYKLIDFRLLSMPDDLQEKLWYDFLRKFVGGTETEFFRYLNNIGETWDIAQDAPHPMRCEHFLFDMGYELSSSGFIRKPIPEYWLTSEYSDIWANYTDKLQAGFTGMVVMMKELGWNVVDDRVCNYFGNTGYTYLKEW